MSKTNNELPTALVADDESGIREVFTEMLIDLGYRVVVASSAEEAHAKVLEEPVSLAFVDI